MRQNLKRIFDGVSGFNSEHVIATDGKATLRVAGLENLSGFYPETKIAIICKSTLLAVEAMCVLDGACASLAILSPSDQETLTEFFKSGAFNVVYTDCSDVLEGFEKHAPAFNNLTALIESLGDPSKPKKVASDWILSTSGTTGRPKLVQSNLKSMTRTVKSSSPNNQTYNWGLVYEHNRYAGLQVILQSLLSGGQLLIPGANIPVDQQIEFLKRNKCTLLSGTPTFWRRVLMSPHIKSWPIKQITLGGEIADGPILKKLAASFPEARITHIFASTEAGVGFAVSDGKEGFPLKYIEDGYKDIQLKIDNDRLYIMNPEAQKSYLDSNSTIADNEGWVDTGDSVKVENSRVYFLGRESGVINVGGVKVHPETIEAVLSEDSNVSECIVFAIKNPIVGALISANVVLKKGDLDHKTMKANLSKLVLERLGKSHKPARISFVDEIPKNLAGKLIRNLN